MPIYVQLVIGLATPIVTLIGVLFANNKSHILMDYKLSELEKKVDKHNNLVERMYNIEERVSIVETRLDDTAA